ncbi:zinc ABC transporter substrate-binding protein [Methylonatrum kenyense]|uniref:metal ABC transporter solute-binding protein, Zn/Mn family n=1 Tax=Methylonatrum kenyense TaxID=455253 RepID=UPI0020BFA86E|nr:zinc ABC transporter substrate-binding protein [Methylonatrum kenyense]MCK8516528.1 zinc ABC transporter substrate-binding protein [Methylonatrum kenyense]
MINCRLMLSSLAAMLLASASPVMTAEIPVTVSVAPQGQLVEAIGGDRVRVSVMVDPGQSSHTFSPSPRRISALSDTRLYVKVGHPEYSYERRFLGRLQDGNGDVQVVSMADHAELRGLEDHHHGHGHDHDHAHGDTDPHLWVSPRVMRRSAEAIAEALIGLDPDGRGHYERNLAQLLLDIDALDQELTATLEPLQQRRFLVNHPAWGYFADEYALTQRAIEHEGKDPSPAQLARLIEEVREAGIRTVIVQPGFSSRGADLIARELDTRSVEVDPLAPDWPESLRKLARALAEQDS